MARFKQVRILVQKLNEKISSKQEIKSKGKEK